MYGQPNFGWDLPPGVTNKMIDDACGSPDECPDCEGEGKVLRSNCCDANFYEPGWPDSDICSACKEHAEPQECETCKGTGVLDLRAEKQAAYEEWQEHKAEEERQRLCDEAQEADFLDRHIEE